MKESYALQPNAVDVFPLAGQTDVILRKNIVEVQRQEEGGDQVTVWECDEAQFRYPGVLSVEEVTANFDRWYRYANASEMDELEIAKETKIEQLSATCNSAILAGFDIVLSDGVRHHFSLEITDQIMISMLASKAAAGQAAVPWHADDEGCKFFSAEDITLINTVMEKLITYHQTYFNNLKQIILRSEDINRVNSIWYGMEIPEEEQTEVMRAILNDGDSE